MYRIMIQESYGSWPYPSYPPYYFGAPGYIAGGLIAAGLASAPARLSAAGPAAAAAGAVE